MPVPHVVRRRSRLTVHTRLALAALVSLGLIVGVALVAVPGGRAPSESADEQPAPGAEGGSVAPLDNGAGRQSAVDAPEGGAQGVSDTPEGSPFAAIAAPAPTPTLGTARPAQHTVQAGETLISIADRYGLRPETLIWANNLADADLIVVGQALVVPPADGLLYTVEPGDRLVDVVGRYGLELDPVVRGNAIADPDLVRVGETLFLPGARPLAPPASPPAAVLPAAAPPTSEPAGASLETPSLTSELGAVLAATWEKTARDAQLHSGPGPDARPLGRLPAGARLERVGGLNGRRLPVRDPGDGVTRLAMSGWVDASDVVPAPPPGPRELPRSYPENTRMDIPQVFAAYRSQLDGSPYAAANCGPTTLSMALAALGVEVSPGLLRPKVLDAQRIWGNNVGSLITALATVAESYGVRALDLRDEQGGLRRWTLDELRGQVRAKRPVLVQASFRALPGREQAAFYGDHFILLTGLLDDGFLYNDSINSDGLGWDRVISGARLVTAMDATDRRYAYTAFALAR